MPLVPAKCPECGGLVEVDNEKRAGLCQHCGQPFVVEDAIQTFNTYYQTTNNYNTTHNYGDGAVVNVYENENKDFIIESGVLKSYKGANNIINIPNGVFEISAHAFDGLPIETLNIPSSVNSIDIVALRNARYINNITVNDNLVYKYHDGLLIKDKSILWANKNISEINISSEISKIEDEAFSGCVSLLSVNMSDSITSIGKFAFYNCSELTNIIISKNITRIENGMFKGCSKLTHITIPDSVQCICENAFTGCVSIKELKLPCSSAIAIKDNIMHYSGPFDDCTNIEKVILSKGTEEMIEYKQIREYVRNYSSAQVTYCPYTPWYISKDKIQKIILEDGIKNISSYVFAACRNLKSVILPDSIINIGEGAFANCENLESIIIPNSVDNIGSSAFFNCVNLKSITMPDSAISIGGSAFADCKSLSSITIPNGVTSIEYHTFFRCYNLTSITMPNTIQSIGIESFCSCQIENIIMPNSLTKIGKSAFSWCNKLKSISIPVGVIYLEEYVFNHCEDLSSVALSNDTAHISVLAFEGCDKLKNEWRKNKQCDFCGGEFKGLIFKECKRCGRTKRY